MDLFVRDYVKGRPDDRICTVYDKFLHYNIFI